MNGQAVKPGAVILTCDPNWNDCQKKQAKAKAAHMNSCCPAKVRKGVSASDPVLEVSIRDTAMDMQAAFRREFKQAMAGKTPRRSALLPPQEKYHPKADGSSLADDCQKDELESAKSKSAKDGVMKDWDADHKLDLQLGGRMAGPMWMLDASVNRSFGSQVDKQTQSATEVTSVTTSGCD